MKDIKNIIAPNGDAFCPADELIEDYRLGANGFKYSKHIIISKATIDYWKKHADIVEKNERHIIFFWDEIIDEELPPLKIKVVKKNGQYVLMYLKEYGPDKLLISGKGRKGHNKDGNIYLDKEGDDIGSINKL